MRQTALCCWCDQPATYTLVRLQLPRGSHGGDDPACDRHAAEWGGAYDAVTDDTWESQLQRALP